MLVYFRGINYVWVGCYFRNAIYIGNAPGLIRRSDGQPVKRNLSLVSYVIMLFIFTCGDKMFSL